MPIEWQMIPGFSQAQMNGLRDFFDRTISSAIEVALAQQTSQMIEMLQALNDNVTALASVIPNAPTLSGERWDTVTHEQEQPAFEPIPVFEGHPLQPDRIESAIPSASPTISSPNALAAKSPHAVSEPVISSPPRWLRSALKPAPIARLTAYDCFLPPRCATLVDSFWRAVRPLYHGLVKQGLG